MIRFNFDVKISIDHSFVEASFNMDFSHCALYRQLMIVDKNKVMHKAWGLKEVFLAEQPFVDFTSSIQFMRIYAWRQMHSTIKMAYYSKQKRETHPFVAWKKPIYLWYVCTFKFQIKLRLHYLIVIIKKTCIFWSLCITQIQFYPRQG